MSNKYEYKAFFLALACAVLVSACGDSGKSKPQTQVAAKVNKEEISVHQINGILAKTPNIQPEQAKEAGRQVLEKLIDQELLLEKAIENKLDRNPDTLAQLEAARREILARAYVESISNRTPHPSADEIHDYYVKHPELFAERRIYSFNEIYAQNREGLAQELQPVLGKAKSIAEVADWLKQKDVPFNVASSTKAAEQLPIELLPQLHKLKDGQIAVMQVQNRLAVMQLAASRSAPVAEQAATPVIDQYLHNQRRMAQLGDEMKQLRASAKIEYQGDFAAAAKQSQTAARPPEAPTAPVADAKAPVAGADKAVIEKGLSSLK